METPKRKYQKRKTENKISVKHYLNTRLKGNIVDGKILFPLYVRITSMGKSNFIRSSINTLVAPDAFENFVLSNKEILQNEADSIIDAIRQDSNLIKFKTKLKRLSDYSETPLYSLYHQCLREEIKETIMHYTLGHRSALEELIDSSGLEIILRDSPPEALLTYLPIYYKAGHVLESLKRDYVKAIPFYNFYKAVCDLYYPNGADVASWQSGEFQTRMLSMYPDDPNHDLCKQYLDGITRLFSIYTKY